MKKTLIVAAVAAALSAPGAMAERGKDGHLNIIYWQAASILNPFLSGGTKDVHSSSLIIERRVTYRGERWCIERSHLDHVDADEGYQVV